jgi:hypothetical protein
MAHQPNSSKMYHHNQNGRYYSIKPTQLTLRDDCCSVVLSADGKNPVIERRQDFHNSSLVFPVLRDMPLALKRHRRHVRCKTFREMLHVQNVH